MGSVAPPSPSNKMPAHDASPPITNGVHYVEQHSPVKHSERPTILHLGDPIRHNPEIHDRLKAQFDIIHVADRADRERPAFINHLRARTWGDFSAIMRPFWRSGNEMKLWDQELIELLPKSVKVMASAGAGFDWVDDKCLAENGIIYCNGAHASNESVADMALFHIISVFRHMTASARAARSGSAEEWLYGHNHIPAMSHNPRGHTLGIVGLGNIGFAIAVKVKAAFGMKIIYHDIVRKTYDQDDHIDAEFYDQLDNMLPQCDCLLIATPGGPPLLTKRTLSLLRRGSRVVNIARGSLVDEDALADALDSGHIDAAGLDVFAKEPHVNGRLSAMANVVMTCHTGGGSVETNIGFEKLSMENCEAVLNGREPSTPVNIRWLKPKQLLKGSSRSDLEGQNHDREDGVQSVEPLVTDASEPPASDTIDAPTSKTIHPPASDTIDHTASDTMDPPPSNTIDPPASEAIDPPASDTIDPPASDTIDPPASDTIDHPASSTIDHSASDTISLPAVDTQLHPVSTRSLNDGQDAGPLSAQIDSVVSMSMDGRHGVPQLYDQLQPASLPSTSN